MKKFVLAIATSGLIAGCSSPTPDCSSDEATDLVIEITQDEMASYVGSSLAESLEYTLEGIRTREHDESIDTYLCAAELTISGLPQGPSSSGIEYSIESTDAGDEVYVEVFGL